MDELWTGLIKELTLNREWKAYLDKSHDYINDNCVMIDHVGNSNYIVIFTEIPGTITIAHEHSNIKYRRDIDIVLANPDSIDMVKQTVKDIINDCYIHSN